MVYRFRYGASVASTVMCGSIPHRMSASVISPFAPLYSQTGSYSGYGFAIPTSIMNKVVDDLKKYGSVQRVMLSIQGCRRN